MSELEPGEPSQLFAGLRVVVIVPCHNEERTVSQVVSGFRAALPDARIVVYDNNSTDSTVRQACETGAEVRSERTQGKGAVVRRAFSDLEADYYILVDGDATYDPAAAPDMLKLACAEHLDMVTGTRVEAGQKVYRPGHRFGNWAFTFVVRRLFGDRISDMLSGYRVFTRRFVKSFPSTSQGFEIETEFTIHALELGLPIGELPTSYYDRPTGSTSKLRTWLDGLAILFMIVQLVKNLRPFLFFSVIGAVGLIAATLFTIPIFIEFARTGLVPRFPTAILATGIAVISFSSIGAGVILDAVARNGKEARRLSYLSVPLPRS